MNPHTWSGRLRTPARWLLAAFFTLAGLNHFLNPGPYLGMMPAYLPWHRELILASGAAEMAGGLAILVPRLRTADVPIKMLSAASRCAIRLSSVLISGSACAKRSSTSALLPLTCRRSHPVLSGGAATPARTPSD